VFVRVCVCVCVCVCVFVYVCAHAHTLSHTWVRLDAVVDEIADVCTFSLRVLCLPYVSNYGGGKHVII
jgi:hypothetical protein